MVIQFRHGRVVGIGRFFLPVPRFISDMGLKKAMEGARKKTAALSDSERNVHHFVVRNMATAKEPITPEYIAQELNMDVDIVEKIIVKLEQMKNFLFRSKGKEIDWAYPLSLDNTGHKMVADTGEEFFAAWAVDAFATPFVYGRLQDRKMTFTIRSVCANSGKEIEINLDSDLNITHKTEGSEPIISLTIYDPEKLGDKSIVDVFWRKSLFFWSEEEAKEYQRKTREFKIYMDIKPVSLGGIEKMQSAIFGFDK